MLRRLSDVFGGWKHPPIIFMFTLKEYATKIADVLSTDGINKLAYELTREARLTAIRTGGEIDKMIDVTRALNRDDVAGALELLREV